LIASQVELQTTQSVRKAATIATFFWPGIAYQRIVPGQLQPILEQIFPKILIAARTPLR
jgi:hypothetical protein